MKSYQIIAIVIALFAIIWIGSGIFKSENSSETKEDHSSTMSQNAEKSLPKVRVKDINPMDYTDDIVVTGRSQASKKVEIKAETTGLVTELLKEEGQRVKTDDVLARIELRDRKSRVEEAKERVNQRSIEYNAARRLAKEGLGNIGLGEAESGIVTILFADIRSFTTVSEALSPQELLNFLNTYLLGSIISD